MPKFTIAQCSSGCTTTYSSNTSITTTSDDEIICITGGTSYNFTSIHSGVTVKVCAANIDLSNVSIQSSGYNTTIEAWADNTDLHNLTVDADTFTYISYANGARLVSGGANRKTQFIADTNSTLQIVPNFNPADKVFIQARLNAIINTASVTSNNGGSVEVGWGAEFNSSGSLILQNDGRMFNTGTVTVSSDMTIQGGANALNNYCGESSITVDGTFIINNGGINNSGSIISDIIKVNAGGGPIFPHKGSYMEAVTRLDNVDEDNILRGDSISSGCATFKIGSYGSWNKVLSTSAKNYYCGPAAPAGKLGIATEDCDCGSSVEFCNPALPVVLASFSGYFENNAVNLNWTTATEKNADVFIIEKSNGETWEEIGIINASGNSMTFKSYSFNDFNPYPIGAYYRLKEVDFDGTVMYSNVIYVKSNSTGNKKFIYPQPLQGNKLNIHYSNLKSWTLFAVNGAKVAEGTVHGSSHEYTVFIPSGSLRTGLYMLMLITEDGTYHEPLQIAD